MRLAALAANTAWWLSALPAARRFSRAQADVEGVQRARLAQLLRANAATVYGRRHGFAGITDFADYQAHVPLVGYDDLRPLLEEMAAGTADVLVPGQPTAFVPTSGSTAATKLIPYTAALRAEFQAGIAPWIAAMFRAHPALCAGPAYWSISPVVHDQRVTAAGIPLGYEDDTAYLHPVIAGLLGRALAVPAAAARLRDMTVFRYATLLCLLRARELRLISVWNPTFLSLLLEPLAGWADALLRDLAAGTITPPGAIDPALAVLFTGRPVGRRRLGEVERALTGEIDTAALWPRLGMISCWTAAAAAPPAHALARQFPGVPLVGKGLLATEGFVTLPGGALAVCGHVFEFLAPDGTAHPAWQLDAGAEYEVVLTTGGGLYRYRLGDRVRVTGHHGMCPLLDFLGRDSAVSDLYGEKLHEAHVAQVLRMAADTAGVVLTFALLAPEGDPRPTHYTLFFTADGPVPLERLAQILDNALCENVHYAYCRRLGQLQSVHLCPLTLPAATAHARCLAARTGHTRTGNIKPTCLDRATDWRVKFGEG